jgi:hypothetical protein
MTIPNMGHCIIQLLQSNTLQEWINIDEKSEKIYNINNNNNEYMRYKDIDNLYNLNIDNSIFNIIWSCIYFIFSIVIIVMFILLTRNKQIFIRAWSYSKIIDDIGNKI